MEHRSITPVYGLEGNMSTLTNLELGFDGLMGQGDQR